MNILEFTSFIFITAISIIILIIYLISFINERIRRMEK
jgi:uncharacterized protein YoxC